VLTCVSVMECLGGVDWIQRKKSGKASLTAGDTCGVSTVASVSNEFL